MRPLPTRVGISDGADHRFVGYSALHELTGGASLAGLLVLAVTGRLPPEEETPFFDEIAALLCAADGRVWPLKIGRILSAYGKVMPGFAAPPISLEGTDTIGPWTTLGAAELLERFAKQPDQPHALVSSTQRLIGWGVALRSIDERFERLRQCVETRGRQALPNWSNLVRLSEVIRAERKLAPNISAGLAAALLDLGFSPKQCAAFSVAVLCPMLIAHALECTDERYAAYRALPAERVSFVGRAARPLPTDWPR